MPALVFAPATRLICTLALVIGVAHPAAAQTVISGTVRDERGAPLGGANVVARGTSATATTTETGRYRLEIPSAARGAADSVSLLVRRIGFDPTTRIVAVRGGGATADFTLKPAEIRLESVVVTGTAASVGGRAFAKERRKSAVVGADVAVAATAPVPLRDGPRTEADAVAASAAKSRKDVGRAASVSGDARSRTKPSDPQAGILTAAVWDDAQHWPQYTRFLNRARENAWNPWALEIGHPNARPVRDAARPRARRRALDLGFLVDATGSMGDEMAFLQSELKDIVRRVHAVEPDLDIRLSVVFYRDRGDAFITKSLPFTRDVDAAVSFIAGTSADGGGDTPEDMNAGLEAIMRQRWSRDAVPQMLFLIADAPPQQYAGADYTYHEAIQDAAAAGIAIFPVAASGVDKPTEFLMRAMAVMTGGKYVFLTDDSGVGNPHEEPDISGYTVEKLNGLMVREIRAYVAARTGAGTVAENR